MALAGYIGRSLPVDSFACIGQRDECGAHHESKYLVNSSAIWWLCAVHLRTCARLGWLIKTYSCMAAYRCCPIRTGRSVNMR